MISVLLPSRGRPDSLAASMSSLLETASEPAGVQILVAADPDDRATQEVPLRPGDVMWVAPERYGYLRMYEYVNALAKIASGQWLHLWNDDARMLTPGWDAIVAAQQPGVLWSSANHAPQCNIFPFWPKAWSDAMGHVSLAWQCDTWIEQVGAMAGRMWKVPIEVFHDRADVSGGHDDLTAAEGWRTAYGPNYRFWDSEHVQQRAQDALVVRALP